MNKIYILILTCLVSSSYAFAGDGYKGDLNGDGVLDLSDFGVLARAIKDGVADARYDINSSGSVNDADLQRLATMIINRTLVEDNGLNAGIGDWDDDGTDYGGTLSRVAGELCFYVKNVKAETSGGYSVEFGLLDNPGDASAILFNIIVPNDLEFDFSKIIELTVNEGFSLYGRPTVYEENWQKVVRFIVSSPEMKPLKPTTKALGRIYYDTTCAYGSTCFSECQYLSSESMTAVSIPNQTDWIDWSSVSDGITDADIEMISVCFVDGAIRIHTLANVPIRVYDMLGQCVYSGCDTVIPVEKNHHYIVVVGDKVYKVRS